MRSAYDTWPWTRRKSPLCCSIPIFLAVIAVQFVTEGRNWAEEKPPAAPAESATDYEESWQAIYVGKTRVGYGRSSVGHKAVDGEDRVVTDSETTMAISRFKQPVKLKMVTQTEETAAGDLLEFRFELLNPPAAPMSNWGRVKNATLLLTTETNGKTTTKEMPWDESIKSPTYHERQLREDPMKAGQTRTLKMFDPQFAKVSTMTLQAGEMKNVALLGGKTKKLLEVNVTQSLAPQIVTQDYLDEAGDALKTTMSGLLGIAMYKVSKAEALKELTGEEVDLAAGTLIKTSEVKQPRQTKQVVYRVTIPGEDPEASITAGPTQKIDRVNPHTIDLTVTAIGPEDDEPASAPPGKEFTSPNRYIQSDDETVRRHAAEAAGDEPDPWKAAQRMEQWVQRNLKKKNFFTLLASAAEVAEKLSGDCTEHAVLLAAMCRARGIPARVAVGLIYVPDPPRLGAHMWTEVFVRGKWIPLDATLGKGGIAADHIKFADSSFSDEGDSTPLTALAPMVVLSKLKIDVREVRHDK
jgi:hypothetical protein